MIYYSTHDLSEGKMNEIRRQHENEQVYFRRYPIIITIENGYDNPTIYGFTNLKKANDFFETCVKENNYGMVRLLELKNYEELKVWRHKDFDPNNFDDYED